MAPPSSCANCSKVGAALRCGRCRQAVYCNRTCQAADWRSGHQYSCRKPAAPGPEDEQEVQEALRAANGAEQAEPEILTDADNAARHIRSAPVYRRDAVIKELPAEANSEDITPPSCGDISGEADPVSLTSTTVEAPQVSTASREPSGTADDSSSDDGFPEAVTDASVRDGDGSEVVSAFQLDPDFDYDNCQLSQPEWPYNLRPRP